MPGFSLPATTESSHAPTTHPVHRATALLQRALHESRRATFTQEFGEVRGIHRLSAPPAAEVFLDSDAASEFNSQPANLALVGAYLGHPPLDVQPQFSQHPHDDEPVTMPHGDSPDARSTQAADPQLRSLIKDFQERQREAGLVVAGSIASAVTLTIVTIALVFALAA